MPRQRSAQPRYRRRVVLEITPDESTLLDGLADRHGTIRGAVMAGLRGLGADRSAELEAQLGELRAELAGAEQRAQADREAVTAEAGDLRTQVAAGRQALKAAQTQAKDLRTDLRDTRTKLSNERDARRAAQQALQTAEALLVHHAYCATCDKLVPEAEWAEQPWGNGFAIFHRAHGFHEKNGGFLGQPASILFWRARSSAGEQR